MAEKRYCRLFLQKHMSKNRYVVLYEYLLKAPKYDATEARRHCRCNNKPAAYAVLKKQLAEQLLQALHLYDLHTNTEQQLQRSVHQCQLLLQKGHLDWCEKRLTAVWEQAMSVDLPEVLWQLQQLRLQLMSRRYYRNITAAGIVEWHRQTEAVLHQMQTTSRYRYLSATVYQMQYEAGARGSELAARMREVIRLPEFRSEKNATTLRAQLDYYQVRALYHFTNGETAKAADFNRRFLAALDQRLPLKQLLADRYFSVLNNYLIDAFVLKHYAEVETGLAQLRHLAKEPAFKRLANFDVNEFRLGALLELNYRMATGQFAAAEKRLPAIEKGLQQFGQRIVKHNRITLQYLMAYVAFVQHRYDRALDYLQPILQEKESAVAEQVQQGARLLQLLTHAEKGDWLLVESLIKSVRRQWSALPPLVQLVLSFLQRQSKSGGVSLQHWRLLEKRLLPEATRPDSSAVLNMFQYVFWVQAHVQQQPMAAVWPQVH